jgi:hypothetical protein
MARQALIVLMVVIVFGILVPIYKGFGLLDPRILLAYACLAPLFVAPASAELAAVSASGLVGRIAIIVAWGWGITVLILGTAIVTLNIVAPRGEFISPPAQFIASILVFGLSASVAIALLGALLARRFSALAVKNILRTGFLAILLAFVFGSRFLPESVTLAIFDRFDTRRALMHLAWQSSAVCGVVTAVFLLAILKSGPQGQFAKLPKTEIPAKEEDE